MMPGPRAHARPRVRLLPALGLTLLVLEGGVVALVVLYALFRVPYFLGFATQLRSASIATEVANRIQSSLTAADSFQVPLHEFRLLESLNSEVSAFLLDGEGRVLLSTSPEKLQRTQVQLSRVQALLGDRVPRSLLRGENPYAAPGEEALVSVARVKLRDGNGFVYLAITPPIFQYLQTQAGVRQYLLLVCPIILFVTAVSWLMMKLYASYLLRQFSGLLEAARGLTLGDRGRRAPVLSSDEIGHLASSFNSTADAILLQEEEVHRAERSRRFLVAGVLHDLRAPLAAMRGLVELLGGGAVTSQAEFDRFLNTVRSCVYRQRRFVESLEQLSEVELAAESFVFSRVEMDSLVGAIVDLLQPRAAEAGLALHYSPTPVSEIAGDGFWICRAITNVVVNAITYSAPGGSVTVEVRETESSVECLVSDTGVGIASEDIERIFEHFYRANSVVEEGKEGSGLGLAVVKKVVERHHGVVRVESELGRGTVFRIGFPKQIAATAPLQSEGPTPYSNPRIEAPPLVAPARPEYFLTALTLVNWLTTQFLALTVWPTAVAAFQLALLWTVSRVRPLMRFSAPLLPLQAVLMGAMFLFFDRQALNAGRALVAANLTLSAFLVYGFAPVTKAAKIGFVACTISGFLLAGLWFHRFELVAAGICSGGVLGILLIAAFRSSGGRSFRIRFALSVATILTLSMLVIGYETITGIIYLSELRSRETVAGELPAVRRQLDPFIPSSASIDALHEAHITFTQYNPALFGMIVSSTHTALGFFAENGRDFRLEQVVPLDISALCAASPPVSVRLLSTSREPLCLRFTQPFFGQPAEFLVGRMSGRADAIERRQLELAVVEMLLFVSAFCFLGVRTTGGFLQRTFSAPLTALLEGVLAARSEQTLPSAPTGPFSELHELQHAFREMVQTLRQKQAVVVAADAKLRELVTALLGAVRPFNHRLNQLLPECKHTMRAGCWQLPEALTTELLSIVDRETEVVDQLFLLTKLDLGELPIEYGLLTVEELLWGMRGDTLRTPSGASRRVCLESETDATYFSLDSRYALQAIQLAAEELNDVLPESVALTVSARRRDGILEVVLAGDKAIPLQTSNASIRRSLIAKLSHALGGDATIEGTSITIRLAAEIRGNVV